ncbi:hypothetical protein SDC9_111043 [bioreactor metagenome]|uniref:Uncharacterized protein n=1 Tax=bioreactor metagenome TaxID=1076179 RepID=A0A645BFP2_9ZZZZ
MIAGGMNEVKKMGKDSLCRHGGSRKYRLGARDKKHNIYI